MNTKKWFVYDEEGDGYEEFETENQALEVAHAAIRGYLDEGWGENADRMTVGKIIYRAKMHDLVKRPPENQLDSDSCDTEGTYWPDGWDHICNYRMEPL